MSTTTPVVLSLFPGIGLLDMAFEEHGFCVVRGPDVLWGGDIKRFHVPAGRFDGVIGGPPCKAFSQANQGGRAGTHALAENLIPEFERVVGEAAPAWFLMENVRQAPLPVVAGYVVRDRLIDNRHICDGDLGAIQRRLRRFSMGTPDGRLWHPRFAALDNPEMEPCFTANAGQWDRDGGRSRSVRSGASLRRGLRAQGLPDDHLNHVPLTVTGAIAVVGNGVPLPLGRAMARAVCEAMYGVATIGGTAA